MAKQTRTVRVGKVEEVVGKAAVRTFEDILEMTNAQSLKLTNAEMEKLIDNAAVLDVQGKEMAKKVKRAKAMLLANAKKKKWKTLTGRTGVAKVSPSTTTVIPVKPFALLLKKLKKTKMLFDLLSVRISDAKKYLGEDVLEKIWETEFEEYGSVSVSELKK